MFTDEQIQFLLSFCKQNNLYMSGGSDYHGTNKPEIKLGEGKGNLDIPYELVKNWM